MMFDDAGFERNDKTIGREPAQRKDKPAEQLYDREVPLNGVSGHTLLHDWLDGEVDAMRASEVEGKSKVELWTRINAESEMLRRRVTPVVSSSGSWPRCPIRLAPPATGGSSS